MVRGPFGIRLEQLCPTCNGLRVPCLTCNGERLISVPKPTFTLGGRECGSCGRKFWRLVDYEEHYVQDHVVK